MFFALPARGLQPNHYEAFAVVFSHAHSLAFPDCGQSFVLRLGCGGHTSRRGPSTTLIEVRMYPAVDMFRTNLQRRLKTRSGISILVRGITRLMEPLENFLCSKYTLNASNFQVWGTRSLQRGTSLTRSGGWICAILININGETVRHPSDVPKHVVCSCVLRVTLTMEIARNDKP